MLQFDGIAALLNALLAKVDKTASTAGCAFLTLLEARSLGCLQSQEPTFENLPRA